MLRLSEDSAIWIALRQKLLCVDQTNRFRVPKSCFVLSKAVCAAVSRSRTVWLPFLALSVGAGSSWRTCGQRR
eukprot:6207218-Pleurochrysis_carterae.AAC.1